MKILTKAFFAILAGLVLLWVGGGTPAYGSDVDLSNPGQISRGEPGDLISFGSTAVAEGLQGRACTVTVTTTNGRSVHLGNDFIVSSGDSSGTLSNFENEAFATRSQDFTLTLGVNLNLTLRLGADGLSSADATTVSATCPPETTVPETTVPETTEPECVPTGVEVTDVNTGNTYIYGTPTEVGFDTCGNPIPDICIEWPDGTFSTLWSVQDCTPSVTTVPPSTTPPTTPPATTPPSSTPPQLPDTGPSGAAWSAMLGALALALGGGALRLARR